jgi:hypothetical protein
MKDYVPAFLKMLFKMIFREDFAFVFFFATNSRAIAVKTKSPSQESSEGEVMSDLSADQKPRS